MAYKLVLPVVRVCSGTSFILFYALFVWLISLQPAVLFSRNKPATSNQPVVLFSQNKSAPVTSTSQTNRPLEITEYTNIIKKYEQNKVCQNIVK
jgi:hypothetical protein